MQGNAKAEQWPDVAEPRRRGTALRGGESPTAKPLHWEVEWQPSIDCE